MINSTAFPNIETKNLILRKMNYNDINDLFIMRNDSRMNKYIDARLDGNTEETKAYIDRMNKGIDDNKWIIWAIEHRKAKRVVGSVSIWNINKEQKSGELGYGIIPEYQGQGLMKEALLSVVKYGFSGMNLKILEAYTEEKNIKSIKLLEKCNFHRVNKVAEQGFYINGVFHMVVYRCKSYDI